jgi:1-deoxy-D-xylulose-5-phosphate synthase
MADKGFAPHIIRLGINDEFVEHGTVAELKRRCGYDVEGITRAILEVAKQ